MIAKHSPCKAFYELKHCPLELSGLEKGRVGVEWCSGCIINNIYLDKPNIVVFDRIESAQNLKGETLGKFLSAKYYCPPKRAGLGEWM